MQDETGSVRGKLEERRNELNRGVLEKPKEVCCKKKLSLNGRIILK
jgi:hypothetical protein